MRQAEEVLEFWFGDDPAKALERRGKVWFSGGEEFDRDVRERFGTLVDAARAGLCDGWAEGARSRLALIIVLDQFPRNIYRNSALAFASDAKALALAEGGLAAGMRRELGWIETLFFALPLQHAEDLARQKRCLAIGQELALEGPAELKQFLRMGVDYARRHLDVIARFGRFPHRNAVLGRQTTAEEQGYLDYLRDAGQWL